MKNEPTKSVSIRWPLDLYEQIVEYAKRNDVSLNVAVRQLVRLGLPEKDWERKVIEEARRKRDEAARQDGN